MKRVSTPRRRAGFTLIELLVVVAIIAVLVALLMAGVMNVWGRMQDSGAQNDVLQLSNSLGAFKAKYGVYPPSRIRLCSNSSTYTTKPTPAAQGGPKLDSDSLTYLNQIWPSIGSFPTTGPPINWAGNNPNNANVDEILEGDQCLVFFLGGIPAPGSTSGNFAFLGFSSNAKDPSMVANPNANVGKVPVFYTFPANRLFLRNGANFPSFQDYYGKSPTNSFYAYFSANNRANGYTQGYAIPGLNVMAYQQSATAWYNPSTFQLLCAGRDGVFGPGGGTTATTTGAFWAPNATALKIQPAGLDDLSNFNNGNKMSVPQ